jgi:hypothetical protein
MLTKPVISDGRVNTQNTHAHTHGKEAANSIYTTVLQTAQKLKHDRLVHAALIIIIDHTVPFKFSNEHSFRHHEYDYLNGDKRELRPTNILILTIAVQQSAEDTTRRRLAIAVL